MPRRRPGVSPVCRRDFLQAWPCGAASGCDDVKLRVGLLHRVYDCHDGGLVAFHCQAAAI